VVPLALPSYDDVESSSWQVLPSYDDVESSSWQVLPSYDDESSSLQVLPSYDDESSSWLALPSCDDESSSWQVPPSYGVYVLPPQFPLAYRPLLRRFRGMYYESLQNARSTNQKTKKYRLRVGCVRTATCCVCLTEVISYRKHGKASRSHQTHGLPQNSNMSENFTTATLFQPSR